MPKPSLPNFAAPTESLPDCQGILLLPVDRVFRFLGPWSDWSDWSDPSDPSDPSDLSAPSDLPPLHLNLGIEGIEEPDFPIEENALTLLIAARLQLTSIPVLLSGECVRAYRAGLLSFSQWQALHRFLKDKGDV